QAQGGTFVIHEVGNWPLGEQKILLNFLKTKSVPMEAKGNVSMLLPMLLNVRVIASTSQMLEGRAQSGMFNDELLKRLNVFRIEMPPLARRTEEFGDIVMGLMNEITHELHKEHLRSISPEALSLIRQYEWPGNIRELRNVLRVAVINAQGDRIEVGDLPDFG